MTNLTVANIITRLQAYLQYSIYEKEMWLRVAYMRACENPPTW